MRINKSTVIIYAHLFSTFKQQVENEIFRYEIGSGNVQCHGITKEQPNPDFDHVQRKSAANDNNHRKRDMKSLINLENFHEMGSGKVKN